MRTYKGEIECKNKESKFKKFAFNTMKMAKEGLMILTVSTALSVGFNNEVYGDDNMGQKSMEIEKKENVENLNKTPVLTESLKRNVKLQFLDSLEDHFYQGFVDKREINVDKFKLFLGDRKISDAVKDNEKELKKMGITKDEINKMVEIAKNYDEESFEKININRSSKDLTLGFLMYFATVEKGEVMNDQKMRIIKAFNYTEENEFLKEKSENVYSQSLEKELQLKNLAGKTEVPSLKTPMPTAPKTTMSDVVEIAFAGALTGNAVAEYVTNEEGRYLIKTTKENLRNAVNALENLLESTEQGTNEYKNTEKDLEELKKLLARRERTTEVRVGAGTGVNFNYKGFNAGAEFNALGNITDKKGEYDFGVNIGYIDNINRVMNGYGVVAYSYNENNFYSHAISGQVGTQFYLNSPKHILELYGKYTYTTEHEYGGGIAYNYNNIFYFDVSGSNKLVGLKIGTNIPITDSFAFFGEASSNYYWEQIITGQLKLGTKFNLGDNWQINAYVIGDITNAPGGGL